MRLLLATVLVSFSLTALGSTVIESKDASGEVNKISIDGDWARFDGAEGGKDGYMLVNSKAQKYYMVVPAERTIIEFSADKKKKSKSRQKVDVNIKDLGDGPKMAGYATRKYELTANGKPCGSVLFSKQAAGIEDISKLMSTIGSLDPEAFMPEEMLQGFQSAADPCDMAEMQLEEQELVKLGFPMKSLDPKGKTENEVVSIDEKAKLKPELFDLPKDYSRTTVKQMMEGMRKEMEGAMDKIKEMMKEMSPEERAKMEQMMKQFGGAPQ